MSRLREELKQLYGSKCLDQVMGYIDLVDSRIRNRFKGANFVVDIDLGNNKNNLNLHSVISRSYIADDDFSFEMFKE